VECKKTPKELEVFGSAISTVKLSDFLLRPSHVGSPIIPVYPSSSDSESHA
jgi:hypothetical protein